MLRDVMTVMTLLHIALLRSRLFVNFAIFLTLERAWFAFELWKVFRDGVNHIGFKNKRKKNRQDKTSITDNVNNKLKQKNKNNK